MGTFDAYDRAEAAFLRRGSSRAEAESVRPKAAAPLKLFAWDKAPSGDFTTITVLVLARDEEHAWEVFREKHHSLWWLAWKGERVGESDVAIRPRCVEAPGMFVVRGADRD